MAMEQDHCKLQPERCSPDDPNRCVGPGFRGESQCHFKATPGMDKCPMHGGKPQRPTLYTFLRSDATLRMLEMKEHPEARNLQAELALARILLEKIWNQYGDDPINLIAQSATISTLIGQIQRTLESTVKVEARLGELLTMDSVMRVADAIYAVVTEHVKDPDVQRSIAEGIVGIFNSPGAFNSPTPTKS